MEKEIKGLEAIEAIQKKLTEAVSKNKSDVKRLSSFAAMLPIRGKDELSNGVSVHNIRRNAESIEIYFDMLDMLLKHTLEDVKEIKRLSKLQAVSDEYEKAESEKKAEKAEKMRIKRSENKDGTDQAVSEQ